VTGAIFAVRYSDFPQASGHVKRPLVHRFPSLTGRGAHTWRSSQRRGDDAAGPRDRPIPATCGGNINTSQAEFNTALSKIRAAVEHAVAHLKTWRMLSEEGGWHRAPIGKYPSILKAVIGFYFLAICE
jgi:hypothetical protein